MIINVSEEAKKAIQHVIDMEQIPNPQLCIYGVTDDNMEIKYELLLLNGIPHVEDTVFDFENFKISLNSTYQRTMIGTYLVDFSEYPYSSFSIVKVSEENS